MQPTKATPVRKDRDLMRQKSNVSPELLKHWEGNYTHFHRNLINPSLLKQEDLGLEFEYKGRKFKIIGMTAIWTMTVEEIREPGMKPVYWECSRHFVQFALGRKIQEYFKIKGKIHERPRDYDAVQLYLSPISVLKKMKIDKDEDDIQETKPKIEIFQEDSVKDDYNNEYED
jgi:hypothetical protein